MRYERLDLDGKIRVMKQTYDFLKRTVFQDGELKHSVRFDENHMYVAGQPEEAYNPENNQSELFILQELRFTLSPRLTQEMAKQKTRIDQANYLTKRILHVMVHQFNFENGIDDLKHGQSFISEAQRRGLASYYKNGKWIEELWGNYLGLKTAQNCILNLDLYKTKRQIKQEIGKPIYIITFDY